MSVRLNFHELRRKVYNFNLIYTFPKFIWHIMNNSDSVSVSVVRHDTSKPIMLSPRKMMSVRCTEAEVKERCLFPSLMYRKETSEDGRYTVYSGWVR